MATKTPANMPSGVPIASPVYLVDETGTPIDSGNQLQTSASVTPAANQRVSSTANDFATGAIVDLLTLLTLAGTSADANTVASLMGRLTKIRDLLNATLTVSVSNANANGQTTMSASAPIAIASDQSKLPTKAASGDFATGAIVDLPVKGANTKANAMPVTMASDQTAIPTLDTNSAAIKTDLDTVVTQTLTPNVSDRWARQLGQVDLARVLGAALSISNPNIVETNTLNAVRNGQAYVAQARNTTASSIVVGLSVFNGAGSGKSLLITSIQFSLSASTNALGNSLYINTADPALGTSVTPTNLKGGGSASVATCSSSNTVVTPAGTLVKGFGTVATTTVEVLNPNQTILLPAGSANGIAMYVTPATVVWSVAISWIEF